MNRLTHWMLICAALPALLACPGATEPRNRGARSQAEISENSTSNQSSDSSSTSAISVPLGYKLVEYDDAYKGFLIRSMPLTLAFPEDYEPFENEPSFGKWLWTTRSSFDVLQSTLSAPFDEGIFLSYISTTIGFDRDQDSFICGPGCGESQILSDFRKAGHSDVVASRHDVNGIPIWIVETTMPRTEQSPVQRLRFAYLGTMIETNAVMISYRPSVQSPDQGEAVWSVFLSALLNSQR